MKLGESMLQSLGSPLSRTIPLNQVDAGVDARLPEPVRIRVREIPVNGPAGVARARAALEPHFDDIEREFRAIRERRQPPRVALAQLRALAGRLSDIVSPHLACARGCSHCCHVAVSITESEAQLIGYEIRRKPRRVKRATIGPEDYGYQMPCTFLGADGKCSIHAHRPLVCRLLLNVDVDELLCQLHPDAMAPMPRYDTQNFQQMLGALLFHDQVADIRDWFPPAKDATA